jgi:hypothetical protein
MADSQVLRLPCPHCQRVLKIPFAWAGKRGTCPACNKSIAFSKTLVTEVAQSKLGESIRSMLAENDEPLDEKAFDQVTLLLSQGTCRDYKLVLTTLGDRKLSAKQWRRALSAAAARESMRLHIESQLDRLPDIEEDEVTSLAVIEAPAAHDSWQIIARFGYFLRHDTCSKCKEDPTGLRCIYLNYADFLKARQISDERSQRWEKVAQHLLGL